MVRDEETIRTHFNEVAVIKDKELPADQLYFKLGYEVALLYVLGLNRGYVDMVETYLEQVKTRLQGK